MSLASVLQMPKFFCFRLGGDPSEEDIPGKLTLFVFLKKSFEEGKKIVIPGNVQNCQKSEVEILSISVNF